MENGNQETVKIGNQILTEDDLRFTVQYNNEIFTLVYPTPFLKAEIERIIAQRLGGSPRASYTPEHIDSVVAHTYVNELVDTSRSPSWFTSAWTCYDELLIETLYAGYLSFRNKFKEKLRQGGFEKGNKG
jgi:hypothetical protein